MHRIAVCRNVVLIYPKCWMDMLLPSAREPGQSGTMFLPSYYLDCIELHTGMFRIILTLVFAALVTCNVSQGYVN